MKDLPIPMWDESVLAIRAGRKTEARRVLIPHPPAYVERYVLHGKTFRPYVQGTPCEGVTCPARYLGNRLWVKEVWAEHNGQTMYRATCHIYVPKWRSPMYMPKEKARLWLLCTGERIGRLHEMTDDDALNEGEYWWKDVTTWYEGKVVDEYRETWDELNAKRGYPWESNPWVRVIQFEVDET